MRMPSPSDGLGTAGSPDGGLPRDGLGEELSDDDALKEGELLMAGDVL